MGEAADPRLGELVGQEAEPEQDRRPPPTADLDFVDGHPEHITRAGKASGMGKVYSDVG